MIPPTITPSAPWQKRDHVGFVFAQDTEGAPNLDHAKRRILIVEDDYFVALMAQSVLEDAGYDVVGSVINLDGALAAARALKPDLVLMDVRLDGSDGIDTAKLLLERLAVRSLFVTAHNDAETRDRAQSVNPLGWIEKPFSNEVLLRAVKDAFEALDRGAPD